MKIVDARNEQEAETATNDNPPSPSHAGASDSISPDSRAIHRALRRLLRKRVKRFVALAPDVHPDASSKTDLDRNYQLVTLYLLRISRVCRVRGVR
jgi:hypothetical protein